MKRRVKITESDLHRIVKESVKRILKESENNGKKEIFTIDGFNVETEEDASDMKYCGAVYYSEDEAVKAAREYAKICAESYEEVIIVTVSAGEYETSSGDIYGEPYEIYSISSKDKETTIAARREAGFVHDEVDEYVG